MSSIVDSSSTLEEMKSANYDFVELILKLKALLNDVGPITFTMGKYTITVNTVFDLITNYKNGKFDAVLLGGQTSSGKQVKLSVDNEGNLCVTDGNGEAVSVSCNKLIASIIDKCVAKVVTAESVTIRSIEGRTSIKGGNVSFDSMNFSELDVGALNATRVRTENLIVEGSLTCDYILAIGTRKFAPKFIRNMFYRNNTPLEGAASLLVIDNGEWNMNAGGGCFTPSDLGFLQADVPQQLQAATSVPDMVVLHSNIKVTDFKASVLGIVKKITANVPINTRCYVAPPNSSEFYPVAFNTSKYSFAALMAFPTGAYSPYEGDNGTWWLTSFSSSDIGKEIYYKVMGREWVIYRMMTITYENGSSVPASLEFGGMITIPSYTCSKFIINCIDSTENNVRKVVYVLEYA